MPIVPSATFATSRRSILAGGAGLVLAGAGAAAFRLDPPFAGSPRAARRPWGGAGGRNAFWQQCMWTGLKAAYDGIKAQTETDFTADLKRFDVPTLIIHGSEDQLVPIGNSATLQQTLVRGATLKVYQGAPHGLPVMSRERFNADLLAFVKS